jgi:hypothetical protein
MAALPVGTVVALVIATPLLAGAVAWLLVRRGDAGLHWMKRRALREFDGSVPFFDDRPVRVEDLDGQVRIAAADVFAVLDEKPTPQMLRRLQLQLGDGGLRPDAQGRWWFAAPALLQWLDQKAQRHDRLARNFHLWLDREVLRVLKIKREAMAQPGTAPP